MRFGSNYMKFIAARSNTIRTFGLRSNQFVCSFIIDFSDILETPYFAKASEAGGRGGGGGDSIDYN